MIKYLLRNMWRRKARTFLTVFGIVVGIFALTVLGGMSARLNQQVAGAESWFTSQITVVPEGGSLFGGGGLKYFELPKVDEVRRVDGVEDASAGIGLFIDDSAGFSFGAPDLIIGLQVDSSKKILEKLLVAQGRMLEPEDGRKVVVGSAIAEKLDASVGEELKLKNEPFEVVGILESTLSAPDQFAFIGYPEALELFLETNPYIKEKEIVETIYVTAESGVDPERVSERIADEVSEVRVISPDEAGQQISQFSLIFNAILLGIGLIALLVGGLSIINTMIMSVSERTREIGLKKAIGAETRSILGEYLLESAMIGLLGGLIGTGLGVSAIAVLNSITSTKQVTVFAITPTVVIGPVVFAVVLGTVAGFFPALRAARLEPVQSLREE